MLVILCGRFGGPLCMFFFFSLHQPCVKGNRKGENTFYFKAN